MDNSGLIEIAYYFPNREAVGDNHYGFCTVGDGAGDFEGEVIYHFTDWNALQAATEAREIWNENDFHIVWWKEVHDEQL